jgi:serine/threonine protein kinase
MEAQVHDSLDAVPCPGGGLVAASQEPALENAPGDLIDGHYLLVEPIGCGGMGTVWRARDDRLGCDVALKLVNRNTAGAEPLDRLVREARSAAAIAHPAVVRVHAFGTTDTCAYIAMELVEGRALDEWLDEHAPLAPDAAVSLLLPIVEALAAVHDAGVVHRDVKPPNILLGCLGSELIQPKLVDFGIARLERDVADRLTRTGAVMGTPFYMSPEQATGRHDIDHRSDLWSICAVLYEALSGVSPFEGDNYNAVLGAVLLEQPRRLPGVDDELWSIIERGLEKSREARWQTAAELADALARWMFDNGCLRDVTGRVIAVAPPSSRRAIVSAPSGSDDLPASGSRRRLGRGVLDSTLPAPPPPPEPRLSLRSFAGTVAAVRRVPAPWLMLAALVAGALVGSVLSPAPTRAAADPEPSAPRTQVASDDASPEPPPTPLHTPPPSETRTAVASPRAGRGRPTSSSRPEREGRPAQRVEPLPIPTAPSF